MSYVVNEKNEEIMKAVKSAVSAQLKSPASAQFPEDLISIDGNDQSGYEVTGFVDSQNSYGAMIRNDFKASVSIVNGEARVSSATVAAKANVDRAKEFGANYVVSLLITLIGGAIMYFIIMSMF